MHAEPATLATLPTPLGPLIAGATAAGICLLEFADMGRPPGWYAVAGSHPYLDQLEAELAAYFAGTGCRFTVPVAEAGTPFQRRVWGHLRAIPAAETRSYGEVALGLGVPKAVRAVGRANGLNRVLILTPCHRVVAKGGTLGGYSGGLGRKRLLLELERRVRAGQSPPTSVGGANTVDGSAFRSAPPTLVGGLSTTPCDSF